MVRSAAFALAKDSPKASDALAAKPRILIVFPPLLYEPKIEGWIGFGQLTLLCHDAEASAVELKSASANPSEKSSGRTIVHVISNHMIIRIIDLVIGGNIESAIRFGGKN
jgi:hypothetical protein